MDGHHGLYQKFCMFDPSIGVPLMVSQPGTLPENKTCDALVNYFSIFPTLAELTGGPLPKGIEAESFANLVRNPAARGPEAVFSEYNLRSANDCYMIRTRTHKYIYNHGDIPELYDLAADPREEKNRAADASFAKLRGELHGRLIGWFDPARNRYRHV